MLNFLITPEHTYTHNGLLESPVAAFTRITPYSHFFSDLEKKKQIAPGCYVFTDQDRLHYTSLSKAASIYRELKCNSQQFRLLHAPFNVRLRHALFRRYYKKGLDSLDILRANDQQFRLLNNPATVKLRYALLRTLYKQDLNSFNVYRVDELVESVQFPVFLRYEHDHKKPMSGLLKNWAELDHAIRHVVEEKNCPVNGLIIVEYCAEPLPEGVFRKLSAYRIGNLIVPTISVFDTQWNVKYGQKGIASQERYEEELELIKENPYQDYLRKVFDLANIEYGRVDFSIVNNRIEVYEINTNPSIAYSRKELDHPYAARIESMNLVKKIYLEALATINYEPSVN